VLPDGTALPGNRPLLRAVTPRLVEELAAEATWAELPIALIDVETTAATHRSTGFVEIGIAIARGGQIVDRKNWLVNPGDRSPKNRATCTNHRTKT